MSRKWTKPRLVIQPRLQDAGVEYWFVETSPAIYRDAVLAEFNRLGKEHWIWLGTNSRSGFDIFARSL